MKEWTGTYFKQMTLRELGLRVQLGHPPGVRCLFGTAANKDFVLIDTTGIHFLAVDYCGCTHPVVERRQQVMRACWWPATSLDPQTCATFNAIKQFHLLNCLGHVSAYDYLRMLELLTSNDGLIPVPVCIASP